MIEGIIGLLAGYAACKLLTPIMNTLGIPISETTGPGPVAPVTVRYPAPAPRGTPIVPSTPKGVPVGPPSPRPAAPVVLTSTAPAYPSPAPRGLPAFPSGWQYVKPVTPAIAQRAQVLLTALRAGEKKQEMGPNGQWITYWKQTQNGKSNVTAWQPKPSATTAIRT